MDGTHQADDVEALVIEVISLDEFEQVEPFIESHPRIRTVLAVQLLITAVKAAIAAGHRESAVTYHEIADLICGADVNSAPGMLASVKDSLDGLAAAGGDDASIGFFLRMLAIVEGFDLVAKLHPLIAVDACDLLNDGLRIASRPPKSRDDLRPMVVDYARRAVALSTTEADRLIPRLRHLATVLIDEYDKTGDIVLLTEAINTARRRAEATGPTDDEALDAATALGGLLALGHRATADRRMLEEAIEVLGRAIDSVHGETEVLADLLHNMALCRADLYDLTGDVVMLGLSVRDARRAVDLTEPTAPGYPTKLNTLAVRLAEHSRRANDDGLAAAIEMTRRAIDLTERNSPSHAQLANNLSLWLAELFNRTGDTALLDQATIEVEESIAATPPNSPDHPSRCHNLALYLVARYELAGDRADLHRALDALAGVVGRGPAEAALIHQQRARVHWLLDQRTAAVAALHCALECLSSETERLAEDVRRRRDIAGLVDGVIADLAFAISFTDSKVAVDTLERPRLWLGAPTRSGADPSTPTVWIASSQWGTVVVSRFGASEVLSHLPITRATLAAQERACLIASRDGFADLAPLDSFVDMTSSIAEAFPETDELLIVPTGIVASLPYAAAVCPDGRRLIERTTLTVAPSAAWAGAARATRPTGRPIGFFHDAVDDQRVEIDRARFIELTGAECPTTTDRATCLAALRSDVPIVHFSCHGTFNFFDPLTSVLFLDDDLSLHDLLTHGTASWLVNLSACETAIPDTTRIEQTISFPTAFLGGGASHVIATLWRVLDSVATEFNRRFYEQLGAGVSPPVATQAAIQRLMALASDDPVWADNGFGPLPDAIPAGHPALWAAFVHYGAS